MFQSLLDLLYPRVCPACAQAISKSEDVVCFKCLDQLAYCPYLPNQIHPIEKIFWGRCELLSATSLLVFSKHGIGQKLVHQLKYKGDQETGVFLGKLLAKKIIQHPSLQTVDAIIPVPLFAKKKHERGYNQSEVFGQGITEIMGIPLLADYLKRVVNTTSQTRKTRLERVDNIEGAFSLNTLSTAGKYKHLLLIDDVVTTGSTLEACINLLSPKHRVSVATLAYQ